MNQDKAYIDKKINKSKTKVSKQDEFVDNQSINRVNYINKLSKNKYSKTNLEKRKSFLKKYYDLNGASNGIEHYIQSIKRIASHRLTWKYAITIAKRVLINGIFNSGMGSTFLGYASPYRHKMILNPLSLLSNNIIHFSTTLPAPNTYSEISNSLKVSYDIGNDAVRTAFVKANKFIDPTVYYAPYKQYKVNNAGETLLQHNIWSNNYQYNHNFTLSMQTYTFYKTSRKDYFKQQTDLFGDNTFSVARNKFISKLKLSENNRTTYDKINFNDDTIPKLTNDSADKSKRLSVIDINTKILDAKTIKDLTEDGVDYSNNQLLFIINVLNNNKQIILPASIETFTDNLGSTWSDKQPLGKALPLKAYTSSSRSINIGLKLTPISAKQLKVMYNKLNFLYGLQYPFYNNDGYAESPAVKLSLGGMLKETYGFITGLTVDYDMSTPWELRSGDVSIKDGDGNDETVSLNQLPKIININFTFFPIGNELQQAGSKLIYGLDDNSIN